MADEGGGTLDQFVAHVQALKTKVGQKDGFAVEYDVSNRLPLLTLSSPVRRRQLWR